MAALFVDRHNMARRYSLDFKHVGYISERSSPRMLSARLTHRQPLELQSFSEKFKPNGTVMKQPTDIFGNIIGPKVLPDEKISQHWPAPPPSKRDYNSSEASCVQRKKRWPKGSQAEAGDSAIARQIVPAMGAEQLVLQEKNGFDVKAITKNMKVLDYVPPSFTVHRTEEDYKPENTPVDPSPRFRDTQSRGGRTFDKPVDPVEIEQRSNVQANARGILPPNTARHEQRKKTDKLYTCRQKFPLRAKVMEKAEALRDNPPAKEASDVGEQLEQQQGQREETGNSGTYRDFSEGPYRPGPEDHSRRVVKQMIQDKIRWCRFQPDGKGKYIPRSVPEKLAIPKDAPIQHVKKFVELNKAIGSNTEAFKEKQTLKGKERAQVVARRKEEKEVELKQWQDTVSARVDEAKTRTRRASVFALDMGEIQATWLKFYVQAVFARGFLLATAEQRAEREVRLTAHRAAISIQSLFKGKAAARKLRHQMERFRVLVERIRPTAFFFLRQWRIRQKQRMADVIRVSLKEHMQTNRVKRGISNFIFNVRRLQKVWRLYLKRERARMTLLSRQWERAFTYVRTKGKAGRLGVVAPRNNPAATATAAAAVALFSPQKKAKSLRFAGSSGVQGLGHAGADRRISQHNAQYISIPQKQVGLLGRLPQFPALKWVTLREELRRVQRAHLQHVHQYKLELAEHRAFVEQKGVVETVLVGFAEDEASAHMLTERLLGGMHRAAVPETPRLHPVLPPRRVQEFILQAVQRIMADFNRQFFDDDHPAHNDFHKPASPGRHKPWWILHESYSSVTPATPRHRSPFRASSPDFRSLGGRSPPKATVQSPPGAITPRQPT